MNLNNILIEPLQAANKSLGLLIRRFAHLAIVGPICSLTGFLHILKVKVFRRIAIWGWNQEGTSIVNRPRPVQNLFFVCTGNICRSPLAEAYIKSKIKDEDQIRVFSAGLETTPGKPVNPVAEVIGRQYGLSLGEHRTTPINREMVLQADLIVVMEYSQRQRLLARYPEAQGKVLLLSSFRSGILTQIPDPYGGTIEQFDQCYQLIRQSCDNLLIYIKISG
jgi:protein-tyrosine phosphatase